MENRYLFVNLSVAMVCFYGDNPLEIIAKRLFAIFSALVVIALKMDRVEEKKKRVESVVLMTLICWICFSIDYRLGWHKEFWLSVIPVVCIISFVNHIRRKNKEG